MIIYILTKLSQGHNIRSFQKKDSKKSFDFTLKFYSVFKAFVLFFKLQFFQRFRRFRRFFVCLLLFNVRFSLKRYQIKDTQISAFLALLFSFAIFV